jgi:hypothetical protein
MHAHGLFMHQKCSNHTLTNLLFGLCRFVWIIDLFIIHPSPHSGALASLLPPKVLWVREQTLIPSLVICIFRLIFEFFKNCGVHQKACHQKVNKILLTYLFRPIYLPIYLFPFIYQMATKPLNIIFFIKYVQ